MKKGLVFLMVLAVLFLVGCGQARTFTAEEQQILEQTVANLNQAFQQLDGDVQQTLQALENVEPFADEALPILQKLADSHEFIRSVGIFDKKGILQVAQPEPFQKAVGLDLSETPKVQKILTEWQPLMSDMFVDQQSGEHAFEVFYPLQNQQQAPVGFLSIYMNHQDFISLSIMPNLDMTKINIGVMQTDGTMLYEENWQEVGLNLFTAEIYQPFKELREMGRKIVAEPEGEGVYRFYDGTMQLAQSKRAKWETVDFHNQSWRIIMNTE